MYQRYHIVYDDLYVHTTTAAVPSTVAEYAIANMPNDNLSHNIQIYPAEPGNLDGVTSDDYDGSEMQKQMRKQTPLMSITCSSSDLFHRPSTYADDEE